MFLVRRCWFGSNASLHVYTFVCVGMAFAEKVDPSAMQQARKRWVGNERVLALAIPVVFALPPSTLLPVASSFRPRGLHAQCSWTASRINICLEKAIPSLIHGRGRVQAGHAVGSCGAVETARDGSVLLPCSPRASRRLYVWKRTERTLCVRVRSGIGWFLDSAFLHVGEEGHLGFGHGFALSCTHAPVPLGRFPFVCGGVDVVLWADTARHLLLCLAICTCPIHPRIHGFHFLPSRQLLAPLPSPVPGGRIFSPELGWTPLAW